MGNRSVSLVFLFYSVKDGLKAQINNCIAKGTSCSAAAPIIDGLKQMKANLPVLSSQYCSGSFF